MRLQDSHSAYSPLPDVARNDVGIVSDSTASFEGFRELNGQLFHAIENVDQLPPFFMSLISADDHWMFIASSGALTCGRKCADRALFPYYSSDKLLDMAATTGPLTIVQLMSDGQLVNWRPWSDQSSNFAVRRSLYKSRLGNRLCFEENNLTLGLAFRYYWGLSKKYGFVRRCELVNVGDQQRSLRVLDGLQNVLPSELDRQFLLRFSNLADAYKKSELTRQDRLGIYYLSSIPTDRAEPNEGMRASLVWHDLEEPFQVLLSNRQLKNFCSGEEVETELDVCGQRGSFITVRQWLLQSQTSCQWSIVADVHQDHSDLARIDQILSDQGHREGLLDDDLANHDADLIELASKIDGVQTCRSAKRDSRHLSNSYFNAMRGGLPADGYQIVVSELAAHLKRLNVDVWKRQSEWLQGLPPVIAYSTLQQSVRKSDDPDLVRICSEYLPLTFSRRHGDPTRPWNDFNIDIKNPDGSCKLAYEGNWRDLFQNWEALGTIYPLYLPAMVKRFVNASTMDGYNPYRITMDGFDWERLDDSDTWANIGYWGDHQIVYLSRLLEKTDDYCPRDLIEALSAQTCVYANVPYRIRDYEAIVEDPRQTIDYDRNAEQIVIDRRKRLGTDGQLVVDTKGELHRVSLVEKLLLPAAIKMTNWIPDAGIWMNTQRPEWNDAQNALVGNGASVVTVCHLRRYILFLSRLIRKWAVDQQNEAVVLSQEVAELILELSKCLSESRAAQAETEGQSRYSLVEALQKVGQDYRRKIYGGVSGIRKSLSIDGLLETLDGCIAALESTIRQNRRGDGLYHSYNLVKFGNGSIEIENLDEMLEGQVAAIDSGFLSSAEIVELLDALRSSQLYREDQQSYLLYPNRRLPRFLQRNGIEPQRAESIPLARRLNELDGSRLIYCDINGLWHFSADLHNANDLKNQLGKLRSCRELEPLIESDGKRLLELYEQTFRHHRFTGRANTFYAYEGLGSIYWHMVSKLSLAACNACIQSRHHASEFSGRLLAQFRSINEGIWLRKSAAAYGAFPTDAYSHTPQHAGAQQPGMTGQVKEDILIRQLELGIRVQAGVLKFDCWMIGEDEWLTAPGEMEVADGNGIRKLLRLPSGSLGFSVCQVPVVITRSNSNRTRLYFSDERIVDRAVCELTAEETSMLFARQGRIMKIEIDWAGR